MNFSTIFNTKNLLFVIAFLIIPAAIFSQGVVVTEDTKEVVEPDESSILDIRSKDKGILIPRMTTLERDAIFSPANGLMVYDSDQNSFYYYDTSAKGGKGGWVRTMSGEASVLPGIAGRAAFFQDANTISAHSSVEFAGGDEDPIFVVKNSEGQIVFAVYEKGVRIFVEEDVVEKTSRGGFAVGGFTTGKDKEPVEYLRVTPSSTSIFMEEPLNPDKTSRGGFAVGGFTTGKGKRELMRVSSESTRIYIDDSPGKTSRGGFAVGGFTTGKLNSDVEFLRVTSDSVRVYIDTDESKTSRGGFAVGGFTTGKGLQELFRVTPDSTRIYIDDRPGKTSRGGFAVGGFTTGKQAPDQFFNIETGDAHLVDNESRILWYPQKEAFLSGRVLVESPDSVGTNSWASGYHSKSVGDWSQALGYKAIARGHYSTAIGHEALAHNDNSFAFGQYAKALNIESYAIGQGATASGQRSFAFGSAGIDEDLIETGVTTASGDYAFAFGHGSTASGNHSIAFGTLANSEGNYSLAMGYMTTASYDWATAMGYQTVSSNGFTLAAGFLSEASGVASMALGNRVQASGYSSAAFGYRTKAIGGYSTAFGYLSEATGEAAVAMGRQTTASGTRSTALGYMTTASGNYSTAMGDDTEASGRWSTAMGRNTTAYSGFETAIGRWNTEYTPTSVTAWDDNDRLFVIGNGVHSVDRSDAMVVLKNGNIGFGTSNPAARLHVDGTVRFANLPGTGTYLTIDANGVLSRGTGGEGGGDVGGSGTAGRVARWSGATTLDDSAIRDDGTNIAVGATVSANHRIYSTQGSGSATIRGHNTYGTIDGLAGVSGTSASAGSGYLGTLQGSSTEGVRAGVYGVMGTHTNTSTLYAGYFDGRIKAVNNQFGLDFATATFENTHSSGVSLYAAANTNDGTALFANENPSGYSLRCDTWDPTWRVAFIVRGSNVGIGLGQPDARLHIYDDNWVDLIRLSRGSNYDWNFRVRSAGALGFRSGNIERITISYAGNVGINTTGPTQRLDVDGQIRIRGGVPGAGKVLTSDANGVATWEDAAAGGGSLWSEGTGDDIFRNNGNVGIGTTSPNRKLHVLGSVRFETSAGVSIQFGTSSGNPTIVPDVNNTGNLGLDKLRWANIYVVNTHAKNTLSYSDRNLKSNINNLSNSLDRVMKINGYSYSLNPALHPALKDNPEGKEQHLENLGFVAQELMKVIPEMVVKDNETGYFMIRNHEQMLPVIIEAIKEQQQIIEAQQKENDDLKARLERLEQLLLD